MNDISLRLKTIATLVSDGTRVCDIGTDHCYLPIYLIKHKIAHKVIATDLREKPLMTARKNLELSGVDGIELRLCDGLSGIKPDEIDTIIIAGMGGQVISGILDSTDWLSEKHTLILQPTTSPEQLRIYLNLNGYTIVKEIAVLENRKIYSIMQIRRIGTTVPKNKSYYYVGEVDSNDKTGRLYIEKQYTRLKKCRDALENVPTKKEEYLHLKSVCEELEKLL